MWFLVDVIGLLSANVVSFSNNVVPEARIFSDNLVQKIRCNRFLRFMLSGRYTYRLTRDTFCIKKSHQIIAGTITAPISRSAAAVAARPAFVR